MKSFSSLLVATALLLGTALSSHAGLLTYHGHYTSGRPGANPGAQVNWVNSKLSDNVTFIGRTTQNGTISENPFNLLFSHIQVSNFQSGSDPELFTISWDLSSWAYQGKQWELAAVFIKDGSWGDTLWSTAIGNGLSGGPQVLYWGNTPAYESGSISHVSFFARERVVVPDAASTLALLGLGLAAVGLYRRHATRR